MPKAAKTFRPVAATANHLRTGAVVYREADGRWSAEVGRAEVAGSPEAADALLARAKADEAGNLVVDPILIEVAGARPRSLRERIRASGPTTPFVGYAGAKL